MKYIGLLLLLIVNCNLSFAIDIPKNATFAAKIVDLETGDVLYENNPDTPLMPASNQKVVTTYAALNLLDIESTFQTSLYTHGKITDGILKGDLYVKFSGDPELTYEELSSLFGTLQENGISKISGKIYIDDEDFDQEYFGHGWAYDQIKFCFSSPISAIMIDKNCEIYSVDQKNFSISPKKEPHFTTIKNTSKLNAKNEFCELELEYDEHNKYNLTGCYDKKDMPSSLYVAARDPRLLAKDAIKNLVKGADVKFAPLNHKSTLLKSHNSRPMKELLIDMMKDSDNQISESIFKLISKEKLKKGSWKNSAKIISTFLKDDLKENNFIIKDGSGASRKNLISPNVIIAILAKAQDNTNFLKTFPQSGMEGTLKNRFMQKPLFENIYAKTGTIDNVSSISGYAFLTNGKKIAFSLITNNCLNDRNLKKFEENLLYDILTNLN